MRARHSQVYFLNCEIGDSRVQAAVLFFPDIKSCCWDLLKASLSVGEVGATE